MASRQQSLREDRIKKLEELKSLGLEPFPIKTSNDRQSIAETLFAFGTGNFEPDTVLPKTATIAGRIRSIRLHGKISFVDVEDESGRIQILIRADDVGEKAFQLFADTVDEGDFIEAQGSLTVTKTAEKSIAAKSWRMLTKAIRPVPSEHYGLKDVEQRLRRRYLDLIANPEVREMFKTKSLFWQNIRNFLLTRGFLEVETPVLENTPGGAEAEPFITHHNALDRDFFLRISLELPLKRLLVGGYERVFEIGRIFRNEGIDAEHLQD